MKLQELIDGLNDDALIGIGSRSGFVFIGTVSEWKEDAESVNNFELSRWRKIKDEAKALCLSKSSKNVGAENARRIHAFESANKRLLVFVKFEEREIKEQYDSANGRVSIIVEGEEIGLYQTLNEYRHIPEEETAKNYFLKKYEFNAKGYKPKEEYLAEYYEALRDNIIKSASRDLITRYEYYLRKPTDETEISYENIESWFYKEHFEKLSPGIRGIDIVDGIKRRVRKKVFG